MKTKIQGILISSVIAAFAGSLANAGAEEPSQAVAQDLPLQNGEMSAAGVVAPQPPAMQMTNYANSQAPNYAQAVAPASPANQLPAQVNQASSAQAAAGTKVAIASPAKTGPYVQVYEFGARWCPSCRKLKPIVHETMDNYKGFAQFTYVDTDSNPDLTRQLNIQQIPQVIIVDRRGRMLNRLTGYDQGLQLDSILTNYKQQIQAKQAQ